MRRWGEAELCPCASMPRGRRCRRRFCGWRWRRMSANLEINREGRVLRVALNRPEKRNALNLAVCRALLETLKEAEGDAGTGAILLEGRGPAFCAGMDLEESLQADITEQTLVHEELFTFGSRCTKPI